MFPGHISPTFLMSFPRSGNGFIRYIMAKAALSAAGYDISAMTDERLPYDGRGGSAWRFSIPKTEEQIWVEDIAPDMHMNSTAKIAAIAPKFHFFGGPVIKTHFLITNGENPYLYLFRDPAECAVSYFHLVAGAETVDQVVTSNDRDLFHQCLRAFLNAYSEMGRRALRHAGSGQCTLLPLLRIEAGSYTPFLNLVASGFRSITPQDVEQIITANPKRTLFDRRLMDMTIPEADPSMTDARHVFKMLNSAAR